MTYPNFQPPQYPQQPQYAPQQPQYAPPQQYPMQPQVQPQQQPAPQLARGTIEDFFNQPSGGSGGSSVSKYFTGKPQGSWLHLRVAKALTNADVRQQTDINGVPATFKDGTPKFVLIIPVQVIASGDGSHPVTFPEGLGSLWVKGLLKDELTRAMAAAGDSSGIPKDGSELIMVSDGEKASNRAGFSPSKLYKLTYNPPVAQAAAPASVAPEAVQAPVAPAPPQFSAPAPQAAQPPQAAPATPADAEKAELLARLQGGRQ